MKKVKKKQPFNSLQASTQYTKISDKESVIRVHDQLHAQDASKIPELSLNISIDPKHLQPAPQVIATGGRSKDDPMLNIEGWGTAIELTEGKEGETNFISFLSTQQSQNNRRNLESVQSTQRDAFIQNNGPIDIAIAAQNRRKQAATAIQPMRPKRYNPNTTQKSPIKTSPKFNLKSVRPQPKQIFSGRGDLRKSNKLRISHESGKNMVMSEKQRFTMSPYSNKQSTSMPSRNLDLENNTRNTTASFKIRQKLADVAAGTFDSTVPSQMNRPETMEEAPNDSPEQVKSQTTTQNSTMVFPSKFGQPLNITQPNFDFLDTLDIELKSAREQKKGLQTIVKSPDQIQDHINKSMVEKIEQLKQHSQNIEYLHILPYNTMDPSGKAHDALSQDSETSFQQKLKEIKPSAFTTEGKQKSYSMPSYLKDDLPNKSMMLAKQYISSLPENIERPSAENLDHIIRGLYRQKLSQDRKSKSSSFAARKKKVKLKKLGKGSEIEKSVTLSPKTGAESAKSAGLPVPAGSVGRRFESQPDEPMSSLHRPLPELQGEESKPSESKFGDSTRGLTIESSAPRSSRKSPKKLTESSRAPSLGIKIVSPQKSTLQRLKLEKMTKEQDANYARIFGSEGLTISRPSKLKNDKMPKATILDMKAIDSFTKEEQPNANESEDIILEKLSGAPSFMNRRNQKKKKEIGEPIQVHLPHTMFSDEPEDLFGIKPAKKGFSVDDQKPQYLQYQQTWVEERPGDYLGQKIPSLLEFLENKIQIRNAFGASLVPDKGKPKVPQVHRIPKHLRQEEGYFKMLQQKDEHHKNVMFASEQATLDPKIVQGIPRKAELPLMIGPTRKKVNTLNRNKVYVNPKVHDRLLESIIFDSIKPS